MLPTILLLASPMGLAVITIGTALAAAAMLAEGAQVQVRRDRSTRGGR